MDTITFAYYCSGHGYGHATRVSAFACHLLSLRLSRPLTVHIISSAPRHVFADSIARGALYRCAEIDPVIVQPLAYRVDRQKSVQALEAFLEKKDVMLDRERRWLSDISVNCVLSDAAFLGCLAAKAAGIPSILITNFTFDSVYSYLATSFVDAPTESAVPTNDSLSPPSCPSDASQASNCDTSLDIPIPESILSPLVEHLHEGYQHADLLLLLPGHIPIPSFFTRPSLPSPQWVNPSCNRFYDHIEAALTSCPSQSSLLSKPLPFPISNVSIPRSVHAAPLLVRPPSAKIHTPEGRAEFLQKTGLPDFEGMKVLVVSFGGQVFKRPGGNSTSRAASQNPSQETLVSTDKLTPISDSATQYSKSVLRPLDINAGSDYVETSDINTLIKNFHLFSQDSPPTNKYNYPCRSQSTRQPHRKFIYSDENTDYLSSDHEQSNQESDQEQPDHQAALYSCTAKRRHTLPSRGHGHRRLATDSHILIPGAPGPASKSPHSRTASLGMNYIYGRHHTDNMKVQENESLNVPTVHTVPPTPRSGTFPGNAPAKSGNGNDIKAHDDFEDNNTRTSIEEVEDEGLLPDENWIAVICGVSKEQWNAENEDGGLPEGFYVAPRDVYMPDLIAVGDVVLGKLGYGMTSECVDACTPFVYVSRPLFVEEHGLRMLLEQQGTGVELERTAYEGGKWAKKIHEAYTKGLKRKEEKRSQEFDFYLRLQELALNNKPITDHVDNEEMLLSQREKEGREMAKGVVEWVDNVWAGLMRDRVKGIELEAQDEIVYVPLENLVLENGVAI